MTRKPIPDRAPAATSPAAPTPGAPAPSPARPRAAAAPASTSSAVRAARRSAERAQRALARIARSRGGTLGILALLAIGLSACARGGAEAPAAAPPPEAAPEVVKVAEVAVTRDAGATQATGKVTFDEGRVSRSGAPVSGRVLELLVQPGDRVRRGQALLSIASPDAESAVADFVAARADEAVAQKALEREQRLFSDQAVPYKEVLQAQGDATKGHAAVARARARLEVLGIDPEAPGARASRYLLRAPIDGVVVERAATPGMEVRADSGTPLVTVADLSRLWVLADVYERDLGRVAAGQLAEVRVSAWPGRTFEGRVGHVGELVDPQTRTVKVRLEVANPGQALKPEMFARVTLRGAGGEAAITVPSGAVLTDGDASAVMVQRPDGRFEKRTIECGPEQDGRVRVLSGLAPGERVAVDGALYLAAAADGVR